MKIKKHHIHFFSGAFVGIGIILFGTAIYLLIQQYIPTKEPTTIINPVLETKKTEVKELPEEFKKEIKTATPSATYRIPILMYHYVENVKDKKDKKRLELNIPSAIFELQVKTLVDAGFTFMTAKDLGDVLDGKTQLPSNPVLLTFDDGHWDLATDVLPILEKYHVKATAYVIPGFIGGSDFLTEQELQDVITSGLVDIGAHTVHHISLKGSTLARAQYEIDQSKTMLEQDYHIHVVSFAYPYGTFDQQAVQVVKDDGFTTGVSTVPGIEQNQTNRFYMFRLRPGYRTGDVLLTWLSQNSFKAY